jgi:hypothetical protein
MSAQHVNDYDLLITELASEPVIVVGDVVCLGSTPAIVRRVCGQHYRVELAIQIGARLHPTGQLAFVASSEIWLRG